MKLKIRQTEIEISYLLLCTAAAAVILNVFQSFVYCAAAVVIHESGHLIAMKRIGYFPKRIKISLFEINIRDDSRQLRTAKENMLIIFFGPAANFICFLPAFLLYLIGTDRIFPFAAANLSVGLFNLLPVMSILYSVSFSIQFFAPLRLCLSCFFSYHATGEILLTEVIYGQQGS